MDNRLPDTRPFAPFEWMLAGRYLRARRREGFISVLPPFSFPLFTNDLPSRHVVVQRLQQGGT